MPTNSLHMDAYSSFIITAKAWSSRDGLPEAMGQEAGRG